ncbi:MAG TPA: PrsW family glutamic-type intramembrane protease, partial [Chloroflexia bacterium]|nr:PrsW family glutamic-type intramembrane protease [Chloroflexia bacterium]
LGFGMLENTFYNVQDVHNWGGTATLRVGTVLMHALASALFGLAWFYRGPRADRRRFRRYAAASLGVHGLWNGSAVAIMALSVAGTCQNDPVQLIAAGGPAGYAAASWLGALTLGAAVALTVLARQPAEPAPHRVAVRPEEFRFVSR